MGKLAWLRAVDRSSFDTYTEFQACRLRERYEAALLLARLLNAQRYGSAEVGMDHITGTQLYLFPSGREGMFYTLNDVTEGADVGVLWIGTILPIGILAAQEIAEGRLNASSALES
jgi:hypothetical protein